MPRLSCLVLTAALLVPRPALAQSELVAPSDNLVTDGLPPVPAAIAAAARPYSEFRAAGFWDWHRTRREMIMGTRFGDPQQLHQVKLPGGARIQLTFFPDPVSGASYQPTDGRYIVFTKDVGGGELFQKYRYDVATGEITLLTDGKARNVGGAWSHKGDRYAYISTRRTGRDLDLWVMDPSDPASDRMVLQLQGGGYGPLDWSPDDRTILLAQYVSVNESYLWLVDAASGQKTLLAPQPGSASVAFGEAKFSRDGKGIFLSTDQGSEFQRLAYLDLATKAYRFLTTPIPSDFAEAELVHWPSFDGRAISGFLYKPPARFAGRRPVIVNIHGGPEGQSRPGFLGRNNYYVNELGVAIIFPNIRGSTGYGKTFTKLDNGVLRDGAYKDIGALLEWIRTRPDLDADHVLVTGGSYGGHMTLVTATQYDGPICCSVDVVGISNLATFLQHTSGYRQDLRRVEAGDERDSTLRAWMERTAPLNNVDKVTKPLFIIQGMNDPRVPRSEAEQMVTALKRRSVPVWYLMAKDEGHGFRKKGNQDFQFYATILFTERYLLGQAGSATP